MSAPGGGQPPQMTPQQQQALMHQQALYRNQQQQLHQQQMYQRQHLQQQQHQQQQQQQGLSPFARARTPQQLQPHPPGGSPSPVHLMHPHLQQGQHLQPRSPMVAGQGGPGSVGNPGTPQIMQHQMGINQPMSLPPSHVSRPASIAPPSSVPANLQGGPPNSHMDHSQQSQYPMHLHSQQTPSRPGSQMSGGPPGGSGGQGGPLSVQQPGSIQRPGSVMAPGSINPPGSHNPLSHSAPGPQSVHSFGPSPVQPGSVRPGSAQSGSIQPGSVQPDQSTMAQQPQSVQPASVQPPGSAQAPSSVQAALVPPGSVNAPGSLQPPPSAASGTSAATGKKDPLLPNEEEIRMVEDPVLLVKNLVQKDLRHALLEMNKRASLLMNPKSTQPQEEVLNQKRQYKRSANDFNAVCDEIDRTLTSVLETAKQLNKLDKVFQEQGAKEEMEGEAMVNCVQQFVDNTELVQKMFDGTIGNVTEKMEKIRRRQKKWEELQKKKAEEEVEMAE